MALRFLDSDESHISCLDCSAEDQELRGCVPTEEILEEENEDTGFYFYWAEELGIKRTPFVYEDIASYVCPRAAIKEETYELISFYSLCKQLVCLPEKGGLNDQPAILVEAFTLISGETTRLQEKRRKKNAT